MPNVRKIKVIVNDDIRIYKVDKKLNYENQLNSISNFVVNKFKLEANTFTIRYKDDEGDLVTISEPNDLEEAYDCNGLPKLFIELKKSKVEPKQDKKQVEEEKIDDNNNNNDDEVKPKPKPCHCGHILVEMEAQNAYKGRSVECDECGILCKPKELIYHCSDNKSFSHPGGYDVCIDCYNGVKKVSFNQFIRDLRRNNKLKNEFEKFLVEFLDTIKTTNTKIKDAFNNIIKKYNELNKNSYVQKVINEQLDLLVAKYEDLIKFIAKNINPKEALIYADIALNDLNSNIKSFMLGIPPFKFMFDSFDNNGGCQFNWGQTDDGKNKKKQLTKEEKKQQKINLKKQKLEKKKQKLLEKLKQLEEEQDKLNDNQKGQEEKPKEVDIAVEEEEEEEEEIEIPELENNNNNNIDKEVSEEMSEEFQILEDINNNNNKEPEIEIINEEPKIEVEEEAPKPKEQPFPYEDKLNQVKGMGFQNEELIKALLIQYKGNLSNTVNHLLPN